MSVKFFVTTGSTKTDRKLHFWDGNNFINTVGGETKLTPSMYGGGWQNTAWRVNSGRYIICFSVDPSFNSGSIAQTKARWSDDGGQTWDGHGAGNSRIDNVGINDSNDRVWPSFAHYDPVRGVVDVITYGFDANNSVLRRPFRSERINPDSVTTTGQGDFTNLINGYYGASGSPSPDQLNEINIAGGCTRHGFRDTDGGFNEAGYANLDSPGKIIIFERVAVTTFYDVLTLIDVGQTDENIGGLFVIAPAETGSSGKKHTIVIYADRTTDGQMRWTHMSHTNAADGVIEASGTLFNGLLYNGYVGSGSNAIRLGGSATFFYEVSSSLVHCWMKEVNSGSNNSVYYQQLDVTMSLFDSGGSITESGYVKVADFGPEGLHYSINGGTQNSSVYCLVHDGIGGVIKVYKKTDPVNNDSWVLNTFVSHSPLYSDGVAWLMNDFDQTFKREDTFSPKTHFPAGSPGVFRSVLEEPKGIEFDTFLQEVVPEKRIIQRGERVVGVNWGQFSSDLTNYFAEYNAKNEDEAAEFITNKYIEYVVGHGGDFMFKNNVVKYNKELLETSLKNIFNTSKKSATYIFPVNNCPQCSTRLICPTCGNDLLSYGVIGFWSGALLSNKIPPPGSIGITSNNVIFPGAQQKMNILLSNDFRRFSDDIVSFFRRHLITISGITIALVPSPGGAIPTPFPWHGYG